MPRKQINATVAERGTIAEAMVITGKRSGRAVRALAAAGEFPGAAKIGGEWTFDLAKLRAYVERKERECLNAAAGSAAPRRTRTGAMASFRAALRLPASKDAGAYEQAMKSLLGRGSRQSANAR